MKVKDFIANNRELLLAIVRNGINPTWATYSGMLEDYERLKAEGHSQKAIVYYLCEQYCTSPRNVYRILTKLGENII